MVPADAPRMTLAELNGMTAGEFARTLGAVFERSPWVAERAWASRPFASVEALHAAMTAVVRRASADERLALLRAHPDLAGRAARAGTVTATSAAEQASAGLDRLGDADYDRFQRLNRAYRVKYGFPFIIAVRQHDVRGILEAFETRLTRAPENEMETALGQVFAITRLRLAGLVEPP